MENALKSEMYGYGGAVWYILLVICSIFLYNEYLIYYVTIYMTCSWPMSSSPEQQQKEETRVMMLTDIHLLGPYRGHWFDKLRRFAFLFFFILSAKIKVKMNCIKVRSNYVIFYFRHCIIPRIKC